MVRYLNNLNNTFRMSTSRLIDGEPKRMIVEPNGNTIYVSSKMLSVAIIYNLANVVNASISKDGKLKTSNTRR